MSDEIKLVKAELREIDGLRNFTKDPVMKAISKFLLFGEFIVDATDKAFDSFQQSKRDELIEIILSNNDVITTKMVNDVSFIMCYLKVLDAVNRLASNDKVVYFAHLLKNGFSADNKLDVCCFEEYLYIIDTLSYRELQLLVLVYNYTKDRNKVSDYREYVKWEEVNKAILSELQIDPVDLNGIYSKLRAMGLLLDGPASFKVEKAGVTKYFEAIAGIIQIRLES